MTDKPKRKRTPNRRRKFLLMIALPILALMAGYVALKPQMDAWLATDPFTPPCHFETDRLFATGYPARVSSVNVGQYKSIENANLYSNIQWSPDGQFVSFGLYREDVSYKRDTFIMTSQNEILYTFGDDAYFFTWTPNSDAITYSRDQSNFIFNIQTGQESPLLDSSQLWSNNLRMWSPDSRYLPFIFSSGGYYQHFDQWIIKDMEDPSIQLSPWEIGIVNSELIGWSKNSQYVYFTGENRLYQYDVIHDDLIELFHFPYEIFTPHYPKVTQTVSTMSPDHTKILISLEDKFTFVIELEPFKVREIKRFQPPERILWHPDSEHLITINGSIGYESTKPDKVLLYNIEQDTIHPLDLKTSDGVWISPTGQYLSYVVGGSNYGAKTRRIYDIDTGEDRLVGEFNYNNWDQWLYHDGKDYLVLLQAVNNDREHPLLAYIVDPVDNSKCKIGWTTDELEFQPQG